ncbi:histone deacetylase family protein [Limimaricola pyoseonensis]|uniref:Acetoin utilization deacetylase AcuC n=1 Tax=Limimaricola pyoseonensis TaxID=521013 RepID=A0A1G7G0F8_9RHOB|nr:histone deacetylase family protein [Limimaricola pyoseonensis]SDE81628.1 Acetoin utilization deacetylase AcuC [Limimaricola pyoseonensis]
MRCFFAPESEGHDPDFRLTHGRVERNAERAERGRLLLAGLERLGLVTEEPPACDRADLEAVHTPDFVRFLETVWPEWQKLPRAGAEVVPNTHPQKTMASYPQSIVGRAGWHMADASCPMGEHSWTATRRAADCAVAAAEAVLSGERAAYALCRPPGHHSDADSAAGHCLLNNAAIAAGRLRRAHERVAVLDIDVHHGNGTQAIFYDRADVLTVSVHADPSNYYPFFVGYDHETGSGEGAGFNLNIPLERDSGNAVWLDAIRRGLARIAEFAPGALVVSLGLDAHENDPLRGLAVTTEGFRDAGRLIADAGLPSVLIQEGGYLSPDLTDNLAAYLGGALGRAPARADLQTDGAR